ncbi:helix-turn-helix domain-containing protein [Tsukamurella soli]|uniref:HTH cro/C1-type domain-containing protein n=1 Tax=Tsukamurella soli TaxID=644556 RepID=A0ABP8JIN6_9ACTN
MSIAAHEEDWIPGDSLATRVTVVRATLGINRKELSERSGLSENVLQSIEDGRSVRDAHKKVSAIARATGVSREWLAFGGPLSEDGPTPEPPGRGVSQPYRNNSISLTLEPAASA